MNPHTADQEFSTSPRHEFNFWFDSEAAHIVLRAHWPRIDVTTVDVSVKAPFTQQMVDRIAQSKNPAARYIAGYSQQRYYLWDEFAACAWLDRNPVGCHLACPALPWGRALGPEESRACGPLR